MVDKQQRVPGVQPTLFESGNELVLKELEAEASGELVGAFAQGDFIAVLVGGDEFLALVAVL